MADPVVTQTQTKFPRNELAELARSNPRLIKAFEALFMDVGKTLPDAIDHSSDETILLASITSDASRGSGFRAEQTADQLTMLQQTAQSQRSVIAGLLGTVADLQVQLLAATRAQSSVLTTLRKDIDDVRALIQGI